MSFWTVYFIGLAFTIISALLLNMKFKWMLQQDIEDIVESGLFFFIILFTAVWPIGIAIGVCWFVYTFVIPKR